MYHVGSSPVHEVDQALMSHDKLLLQLKRNLATTANRMKQTVDKNQQEIELQEGDMAFLKLQSHRQSSVFKRAHQKLDSKFFGPYQILYKVGVIAYKLQLPEGAQIHPVFHMSLLNKVVGDLPSNIIDLPPIDDDGVIILELDSIIDSRWLKSGGKFIEHSLIRWKWLPLEEAT